MTIFGIKVFNIFGSRKSIQHWHIQVHHNEIIIFNLCFFLSFKSIISLIYIIWIKSNFYGKNSMKNHESHLIIIDQKQFKITSPFLLSFDFQITVISHILIDTIHIFEIILMKVWIFIKLKLINLFFWIYFLYNLFWNLSRIIFILKCHRWLFYWGMVNFTKTNSVLHF